MHISSPARVLILLAASGLAAPFVRAAELFGADVFYLGDPHAHTGVSVDGGSADLGDCEVSCGDFATVIGTAHDNGLDWVAFADHVNGNQAASAADYAMLTETSIDGNDPAGGFVTLPAAEVWFKLETGDDLGHKTLLMFGDDTVLSGLALSDVQPRGTSASSMASCSDIWTWMEELTAAFGPALLTPHHPSLTTPMPTDWSCHSDTWEPAVEVYSAHGNSMTASVTYDPPWSGPTESGTVEAALDPGRYALRMGFIGGTDSHDTRPGSICDIDPEMTNHPYGGGLTIAVIPEWVGFDRSSLYDAIVTHHTYATTGPLIPLAVTWGSGGALLGVMGDELGLPAGQPLDISVSIPAVHASAVTAVTLTGPDGTVAELGAAGQGGWAATLNAADVPAYLFVAVELDGAVVYSSAGCADGGADAVEWLWASPSWVETVPGDLDLDGVTWAEGDCNDGDATISAAAPEIWYDGVDQDCDGNDGDQDGDGAAAESEGGTDCDDTDPRVFLGAEEVWYDGVDQDCSGDDDSDQDEDGFAATAMDGLDCNDVDPAVSPVAVEVWYDGVDQDCDGNDADQDGDGWPHPLDCDDSDPAVVPGAGGLDEHCQPVASGILVGAPTLAVPGGCSSVGRDAGFGWLLALAALRRRPTPHG